jgi:N-acetylmuramoyl-L-alanine amidase
MIRKVLTITLLCLIASLGLEQSLRAADVAANAYEKAKACYSSLKADREKVKKKGEWETCVKLFETAQASMQGEEKGASALFSQARIRREMYFKFKDKSDIEASISDYNRVVREYPQSSLADDSLYNIAVLRHSPLSEDDRSRRALEYLLDTYPSGDMAAKAKELISALDKSTAVESKPSTTEAAPSPKAAEAAIPKAEDSAAKTPAASAFAKDVASPFSPAVLSAIDVSPKGDATSVTLKFSQPVAYSLQFTETGQRTHSKPKLELTLANARPAASIAKELRVGSTHLKGISLKGRLLRSGVRLVFDMEDGADYEVFPKGSMILLTFANSKSQAEGRRDESPIKKSNAQDDDSKKKSTE